MKFDLELSESNGDYCLTWRNPSPEATDGNKVVHLWSGVGSHAHVVFESLLDGIGRAKANQWRITEDGKLAG